MRKQCKYTAQALTIAMVVLVVSSMIALSILARVTRDKQSVVDERASAEALEISGLITDKLSSYPLETVMTAINAIGKPITFPEGVILKENSESADVTALLTSLGDQVGLTSVNFCLPSEGNEYNITLKEADETSPYEVAPGQIWSLPLDNTVFTDCTLNIKLSKGDSKAGFSVTKIYGKDYDELGNAGEYKPYSEDDVETYCFSDDGNSCNNSENFLDSWHMYNPSGDTISINLAEIKDGYKLDTVTVKAVGGNVGVYYNMTASNGNSCMDSFRMIELRASAYCNGVYRGKQILIPERKWHSSMFDYVLFNGEGDI